MVRVRCSRSLITVAMVAGLFAASSSASADAIDDAVRAAMSAQKIPGLALAIVSQGKPARIRCYGLANLEWNVPVGEDTIFQSGSVGKQFTASLVMLLVRDGKIGLDDPIDKYLRPASPHWKGVKVRHLLTHTAGISNALYNKIDLRKDYSEDELRAKDRRDAARLSPGSRWMYSNSGYVILGILIHKTTGRFYGDLLKERIFVPAGMTTAQDHQRARHRPPPRRRLSLGRQGNQEPGLRFADAQHDGRRQPVHHHSRHDPLGRGPAWRKVAHPRSCRRCGRRPN